jgi:peptidoglycan/LPS O-acetylase OafA/YrhL
MTSIAGLSVRPTRAFGSRIRQTLVGVWGAVIGVVPHVLHHVGPLAGAAILAGTGGRLLFFALGLGAAFPMLWRLERRFRTWAAPAVAVVLFAAAFLVSSLVLGPLISGSDSANPSVTTTHGHQH